MQSTLTLAYVLRIPECLFELLWYIPMISTKSSTLATSLYVPGHGWSGKTLPLYAGVAKVAAPSLVHRRKNLFFFTQCLLFALALSPLRMTTICS